MFTDSDCAIVLFGACPAPGSEPSCIPRRIRDEVLLGALAQRARIEPVMVTFGPQTIANLAWGMATLQTPHAGLLYDLAKQVCTCGPRPDFSRLPCHPCTRWTFRARSDIIRASCFAPTHIVWPRRQPTRTPIRNDVASADYC